MESLKAIEKRFVEEGAALEHERWAKWQKWMHSRFWIARDGSEPLVQLPYELYERWERQIKTPYSELSEEEKESDRRQTRKYLPLLRKEFISLLEGLKEQVHYLEGTNAACEDCNSTEKKKWAIERNAEIDKLIEEA